MSTLDPSGAPETITAWLGRLLPRIEADIERRLDGPDPIVSSAEQRLAGAMRYAALGPGKRLRPALAVAACEACGGTVDAALPAASAVELLHAYTLVHDDLPAMDDDDTRRGRPTVHIKYDEATAILAGDGLLTLAFAALADLEVGAREAVSLLARRAGRDELLAGQALDLELQRTGRAPSLEEIERLHAFKTGALFAAACELGAIAAGANGENRQICGRYGMAVGIAFQHADDLDDGDFDQQRESATARRHALATEASALISPLGDPAAPLVEYARWLASA